MTTASFHIAVIGAGPAGLMAAMVLAEAGIRVTVVEQMPSPGRKFLMAGRGGLNLTHSEPLPAFLTRYREAAPFLRGPIEAFAPDALQALAAALGEETFTGSSGRVFPRSFKASPFLRAWLRKLDQAGVVFRLRTRWTGFDAAGAPLLADAAGVQPLACNATVLALGGASWPRLGSDGAWVPALTDAGIAVTPLRPSNCGFEIAWSAAMTERHAGTPLKRIALSFAGETARGDAMITANGIEGGPVYALSAPLREALAATGSATLMVDLRPDRSEAELAERLAQAPRKETLANRLRKATGLAPVAVALLREATGNAVPASPADTARLIKHLPLVLRGPTPMARAISSAGGVMRRDIDDTMMLRARPGVFIAGEMIDWEAPTGGYLLQACFATGAAAGRGARDWLARQGA